MIEDGHSVVLAKDQCATSIGDADWDGARAYCESKLQAAALAGAIARLWPNVIASAVDPGWVPTRMGGPEAPDTLQSGIKTQIRLAISEDTGARMSGRYWHHGRPEEPAAEASDSPFQAQLLDALFELSGVRLNS